VNVTRVCELAAVLAACRHENTQTVSIPTVGTIMCRWCISCGALRTTGGWLVPVYVENIGKHLVWDPDPPVTVDVDPRQMPLPLELKRRRRRRSV
jgi:hypothetical protein